MEKMGTIPLKDRRKIELYKEKNAQRSVQAVQDHIERQNKKGSRL